MFRSDFRYFRSPLTPLKKGGTGIKVPLLKGDLGGSKIFDADKRTFQTSSKLSSLIKPLSVSGRGLERGQI
ncbi:hypothetical protein FD724_27250 [Nostoc sp. C057]|nr:hypothetical protein FD724_27250 [Nostoc sp. C057]